MRVLSFFAALLVALPNSLASPQVTSSTSTSSTQAITLLTQSAAALTGTVKISDVTLTGTARRIAGSDDETGTATLKAIASGASRGDFSYPSGSRSELVNTSASQLAGAWSGPDGVSHSVALHNVLGEPAWFFPAFAIGRRLSDASFVATYVGHETHNGEAVEHISTSQTVSSSAASSDPLFAHLTQVEFFFDSTTLLPIAIAFNVHPDENFLIDIPVEIRFSDYRSLNGGQAPFHVQKFLNNGLVFDFQSQAIIPNSGLSAVNFQVQ